MPYVKINGVNIYYEIHGEGEPIILLNGILASTASWAFQVPVLVNSGYKVILMDFRGQWKSDRPRERYSMEQQAEDVKDLLDHLGIKNVNVLGISYGGEVGMILAIKYPDLVKTLIVACSVPIVDRYLRLIADKWMMAARLRSGKYLFLSMVTDIYSPSFINEKWDFIEKTILSFEEVDFEAFIELLKSFMELNILDDLHKIRSPTLIITAGRDKTKPDIYSKMMHERIPNSELRIIEGAGHVVNWEKPEEFNKVILEFLKKTK
ncbi:MAG: alpha/beta fold hydrolase [Candidatus Njordarchaeia archaeon]